MLSLNAFLDTKMTTIIYNKKYNKYDFHGTISAGTVIRSCWKYNLHDSPYCAFDKFRTGFNHNRFANCQIEACLYVQVSMSERMRENHCCFSQSVRMMPSSMISSTTGKWPKLNVYDFYLLSCDSADVTGESFPQSFYEQHIFIASTKKRTPE